MERTYLAVSINNAVYTVNAFRPSKRNVLFFGWSFFASWITIELAWFHLVWQVLFTGYAVRKGVLKTTSGKVGLALNLLSVAGLAVMVIRSIGARREVHAVFKAEGASGAFGREIRKRSMPKIKTRRTRNVPFARAGGKTLRLDVWHPADRAEQGVRRPAIIQIHGGGWVIGDKREQGLPFLKHLAEHGWVGFNVNYRLSPGATFPDPLVDVKRAIAWVREHADEYDVDPNFIAVTGGSAGGHLTALVALTANRPELQPGFEEADTSVHAAVPFYGVYDFTNRNGYMPPQVVSKFLGPVVVKAFLEDEPEKFALASPLDQIHADAPPFLVIHGDLDTLAPVEAARDFAEELRSVSKSPVLYLELKGAQHAFEIFPSQRSVQVLRGARHFLETIYASALAGRDAEDIPVEDLVEAVDPEVAETVAR